MTGMDNIENTLQQISNRLSAIESKLTEVRLLVGPFGLNLSEKDILVQSIHQVKYVVAAHDWIMTPQLVIYRQWEASLSTLLPRLCPPGSVFVDVGANFGYFTCLLASKMGLVEGSKVIAFEPNPDMVRRLRINALINWSAAPIRIEAVAVGEIADVMELRVPLERPANAALASSGERGAEATGTLHHVGVVRLDDVLASEPKVDLIKIDVEGFEPSVFRGAIETLRRPNIRVVFEWSPVQMRSAGFDPAEVPMMLDDMGFVMFDCEEVFRTGGREALDAAKIMSKPYLNVLAERPRS